jgi:glutamate--cysteine ligase
LQMLRDNTQISMQDWALEIMDEMQAIAEFLDLANDTLRYSQALTTQREKIIDPEQTPSARILREMKQCQQSFTEFTMCKSIQNRNYFQARELPSERYQYYQTLSRKSHRQQQKMEARDLTREIAPQLAANGQIA